MAYRGITPTVRACGFVTRPALSYSTRDVKVIPSNRALLAPKTLACFLERVMSWFNVKVVRWMLGIMVCVMALLAGCYVGYKTYSVSSNSSDSALGEEHEVNFPATDALQLTEDALRGDGILFELQPDNSIITLWRNTDVKPSGGWFGIPAVTQPRYRYEIQIVAEGSHKSKILVNVRTQGIPDDQLASYKASSRFELFKEIDELAAKYPPPTGLPASGGVNFALLPNENLEGLAKRVTGSADNWHQIAKDNGIASANDVTPFQNIWVRNSLLPPAGR